MPKAQRRARARPVLAFIIDPLSEVQGQCRARKAPTSEPYPTF
jgi:hypothetical protein